MISSNKRFAVAIAVAISTVALAGGLALAGCAPQAMPETQGGADEDTAAIALDESRQSTASLAEWAEAYPQQFVSYNTDKWVSQELRSHNWIAAFSDEESWGNPTCTACKSTSFNDMYAAHGDEIFSMDAAELESEVSIAWDCGLCHADVDDLTVAPRSVWFERLTSQDLPNMDTETLLCVQCHNSLSTYRVPVMESGSLEGFRSYRNGLGADGLYAAMMEDNARIDFEEETGAKLTHVADGTILESFYGSAHEAAGLTCIDCHMRSTTADTGEAITGHNASGNPLKNDETMEFCVTCHKGQSGVSTADEMRELVAEKKEAYVAEHEEYKAQRAELKRLLTLATADGSADEATLEKARSNYSMASFLDQIGSGVVDNGERVAHNTKLSFDYNSRALALVNEAIDLLQ